MTSFLCTATATFYPHTSPNDNVLLDSIHAFSEYNFFQYLDCLCWMDSLAGNAQPSTPALSASDLTAASNEIFSMEETSQRGEEIHILSRDYWAGSWNSYVGCNVKNLYPKTWTPYAKILAHLNFRNTFDTCKSSSVHSYNAKYTSATIRHTSEPSHTIAHQ